MKSDQIGLQLYTVRGLAGPDMLGTLRRLAELGYTAVEFAGYGGVPVAELRAALDELGIRAMAAHVPLDQFTTRFDGVVDDLKTLGCEHAIVPYVAPDKRAEFFADLSVLSNIFNDWGRRCQDVGLRFGYHNHDFEFAPSPNGQGTLLDAMMGATDPSLVNLELDAYWALFAGVDPAGVLNQYAGRVPLLHVKDMAGGDVKRDAPVGAGVLPLRDLLNAVDQAGVEWLIIEQDTPDDPLADVGTSLRNLQALVSGS